MANADGRLKPEMFATAAIEIAGALRNVMTLPDPAIVLMGGQSTVFVYEQGAYQMRVVQPGERMGGRTTVVAGLKPGDALVGADRNAFFAFASTAMNCPLANSTPLSVICAVPTRRMVQFVASGLVAMVASRPTTT